jgi:hypothetical protein
MVNGSTVRISGLGCDSSVEAAIAYLKPAGWFVEQAFLNRFHSIPKESQFYFLS